MRISEVAPAKPLTPDRARMKGLQQRVKQAQAAVTIERQRQQGAKAQKQILKLTTPAQPNSPVSSA